MLHIKIERQKNRIIYKLQIPHKIKKYFIKDRAYIEFDERIILNDMDNDVFYVPILGSIVTLCWLTGTKIRYEHKIDESYINGLKYIYKYWLKKLPDKIKNFSINMKYKQDNISNNFSHKSGMLFTGGVDSLMTYYNHIAEDIDLVNIKGMQKDIFRDNQKMDRYVTKLNLFAEQQGRNLYFINTNLRMIFNEKIIEQELFFDIKPLSWWGLTHNTMMISIIMPMTKVLNWNKIYIASTLSKKQDVLWGSCLEIDSNMRFGKLYVIHDGSEISRFEKIQYLIYHTDVKEFLVCPFNVPNCNNCDKCYAAIISLLLLGKDPNKYGFKYDNIIYNKMVDYYKFNKPALYVWKDIQDNMLDKSNSKLKTFIKKLNL